MIKSLLITGANAGIGKECARQMSFVPGVEKILLGCRNPAKAQKAKQDLEASTGKNVFETFDIDVSNLDSVVSAIKRINSPIDGLVMNAGGMGGKTPKRINQYGVSDLFAANLLGHTLLLDELLKAKKLNNVAIYAGSEAARGVSAMGMKAPVLDNGSIEEFVSICNMSKFEENADDPYVYSMVKLMAALWMSSTARKYPDIRLVTVSPGGTRGTEVMKDLPLPMKMMFKAMFIGMAVFGFSHSLETGAKRYVDVLTDENYKSGIFYASPKKVTGPLVDQALLSNYFANENYQDNASAAIFDFLNKSMKKPA